VRAWLSQFSAEDRWTLLRLLKMVRYFTREQVCEALVRLNGELLRQLDGEGIKPSQVIYVQIDPAGSSPVALNMLRDSARLEQQGCHFVNATDAVGISEITNRLAEGAVVYVDDFSATGRQFLQAREQVGPCIVGNFPEFLLLPCICEEAARKVQAIGVEILADRVHGLQERPLRDGCGLLDDATRRHLVELCLEISPKWGLGYAGLATMIVYQWNAPNTTPLVLRGSKGQHPFRGVLPRFKDLPVPF
jgi:hypothetical protein